MHEMTKKLMEKHEEIVNNRAGLSDEAKKTKYAREGYIYTAPHSNFREQLKESD
jgi:hypothetical protein